MDIFVGSLPFKLKEEELKKIFEQFGEVTSAKIIIDKITRQNKGFGFVGMPNDEDAAKAIDALDGTELMGRNIVVNKSGDKKPVVSPTSKPQNKISYPDSHEERGNFNNKGASNRNFRSPDKKKGGDQHKNNFKNKNNKGNRFE